MLGYAPASHVQLSEFLVDKKVTLGDFLSFSFTLSSADQHLGKLRIEYGVYYQKANGSRNKKVFKIAEGEFDKKKHSFSKKHSFKEMTTRKHHVGEHGLSIIVNGKELGQAAFMLID